MKKEKKMTVYHGSEKPTEAMRLNTGKGIHDFGPGFYVTVDRTEAEKWAALRSWEVKNIDEQGSSDSGLIAQRKVKSYINKYSFDTSNLSILDLTNLEKSLLYWVSIVLKNRDMNFGSEFVNVAKDYLFKNFDTDISEYDVIIGHRADNSCFSFVRDFLQNSLGYNELLDALRTDVSGTEICIRTEKALDKLKYMGFEEADGSAFARAKLSDEKLRITAENIRKRVKPGERLNMIDILKKGMKTEDLAGLHSGGTE